MHLPKIYFNIGNVFSHTLKFILKYILTFQSLNEIYFKGVVDCDFTFFKLVSV